MAPLDLPAGAKVVYLEIAYIDGRPDGALNGSLVECNYLGENCTHHPAAGAGPADCLTPGKLCSGVAFSGGEGQTSADLSPDDITVDNFQNSLHLAAATEWPNGSIAIGGMIVGYILQVSPPPVLASFNDVPTNHPFFQFVEALHASGITAGCQANPPLYCPDAPLTRGQMAVFLAKALGLQFP